MAGVTGAGRPSNHGGARLRRALAWTAAIAALTLQASCVPLPLRMASGITGTVVDSQTGQPLADALVVVRYEGHYDDILPDRQVLGHREAVTDSSGRFSVGALVRPGVAAWPLYQTHARVVTVLRDGYRCSEPSGSASGGPIVVRLQRAADLNERRDSCRPVPARRGEATAYLEGWRGLFPKPESADEREAALELDRLLAARGVFGYGQNCEGPALDLSLSSDGRRAAFIVAGARDDSATGMEGDAGSAGSAIQVVELQGKRTPEAQSVAREDHSPPRRLAWTGAGDLVLWEPAAEDHRSVSPSMFSANRFQRVWSATGPASMPLGGSDVSFDSQLPGPPLEPGDLSDEADSRWLGRSFVLHRMPDPQTGLPTETLRVHLQNGATQTLALPGEPCGPSGRFGRPHYRIAADTRTSLDLRFVEGGCHAVRMDLQSGEWAILDDPQTPGVCESVRRLPATHFATALRGYARELETAVELAGGDPASAFALRIEEDGTLLDTRNFVGDPLTLEVPDFPLDTPLRRIEVSILGGVPTVRERPALTGLQPL